MERLVDVKGGWRSALDVQLPLLQLPLPPVKTSRSCDVLTVSEPAVAFRRTVNAVAGSARFVIAKEQRSSRAGARPSDALR
jgi:hypothetical protein